MKVYRKGNQKVKFCILSLDKSLDGLQCQCEHYGKRKIPEILENQRLATQTVPIPFTVEVT
jgi:hypothetical protein